MPAHPTSPRQGQKTLRQQLNDAARRIAVINAASRFYACRIIYMAVWE